MTEEAYIFVCPTCFREYAERRDSCEDDGAPLRRIQLSIEDPMLGRMLDERYIIEAKVGEGGMGAVYRAQQLSVDRKIAIKTMHTSSAKGEEYIGRFLREANIASRVAHPHLVSIYDFGQTDDGVLYIVMEFLQGMSLAERLRSTRRINVAQALTIGMQMCSALAAAHDANIVHRDLKPENIHLIDVPGEEIFCKLLDFGIAKSVGQEKSMTQTGQVFGTPDYMSPEQCRGETDIDARADLYALGCILYEMLSGQTPFADDSMLKVLFQHVSAPLPKITPRAPRYEDPAYVQVIEITEKLLRKERGHRYSSALEVRNALSGALEALKDLGNVNLPGWRQELEDDTGYEIREAQLSSQITKVFNEEPGFAPTPKLGELQGDAELIKTRSDLELGETIETDSIPAHPPNATKETAQTLPSSSTPSSLPPVEPITPPSRRMTPVWLGLAGLATLTVGYILLLREPEPAPLTSPPIATVEVKPTPPEPPVTPAIVPATPDLVTPPTPKADMSPDSAQDAGRDLSAATKRTPAKKTPPTKKPPKRKTKPPKQEDALLPFRSKTSILRMTKRKITPKARSCMAIAHKRDPSIIPTDGKVSLVYQYTLKPDGGVRSVRSHPSSTVSSARIDACIKSGFKRLNYGPAAIGESSGNIYEYKATFSYKTQ